MGVHPNRTHEDHTMKTLARLHAVGALLTAGILATAMTAALAPAAGQTADAGGLLRDKSGRTLYVFDKDAGGESRCFDACATAWPPFMAAAGAQAAAGPGGLTLHTRAGATAAQQWGWQGRPLYYYAGDQQPGDAKGDGVGGSWHVVRLAGAAKADAKPPVASGSPYKY